MEMRVRNLIGKGVFIKLKEEISDHFKNWGIKGKEFFATVVGVDEYLGVWVRNTEFRVRFSTDKDGNEIPENMRKEEIAEADILLKWEYIKGILDINDERLKVIEDDEVRLGFQSTDWSYLSY